RRSIVCCRGFGVTRTEVLRQLWISNPHQPLAFTRGAFRLQLLVETGHDPGLKATSVTIFADATRRLVLSPQALCAIGEERVDVLRHLDVWGRAAHLEQRAAFGLRR